VEYCAAQLHDGKIKGQHKYTHCYFVGSVQNAGRGERFGKYPWKTWHLGDTGDHIAGGKGFPTKSDPTGKFAYDKRFWANHTNVKMCFLTAFAVHLLTLDPDDMSTFMFMSKREANRRTSRQPTELEQCRL